jgi:hypothetical protein
MNQVRQMLALHFTTSRILSTFILCELSFFLLDDITAVSSAQFPKWGREKIAL